MRKALRRAICAGALLAVPLWPATVAEAAQVPVASVAQEQTVDDQNSGQDDSGGHNGLWGLAGLVGLFGLAGLARRGPKPGAMAGYPAAGDRQREGSGYPPPGPPNSPPGF